MRPLRVVGAVVLTGLIGVIGFGVYEYLQLVDDLHTSNEHVSGSVKQELTPGGSIVSDPQVTMIAAAAPSADRKAISVVLLSTQPDGHRISTLYVPRSVQLPGGGAEAPTLDAAYETGGLPLVTRTLRRSLGVPINHVAALDLSKLVSMVDGLGGIVVRNPQAVEIPPQDNAPGASFPKGKVKLDGQQAAIYMRSGLVDNELDDRAQAERQGRVLTALVDRMLALPLSQAPTAASAVLDGTASDLSQSDVLGLIWLRFHSTTLTQCLLPASGELATGPGSPLSGFIDGDRSGSCRPRHLSESPIPLPATVASLALWVLIVPAVLLVIGIAVLVAAIWWFRRRRRAAAAGAGPVPAAPAADAGWDRITATPVSDADPGWERIAGKPTATETPTRFTNGEVPHPVREGPPAPLPALDELEGMSRAELFDVALDQGIRHRELIMLDREGILAMLAPNGAQEARTRQPAAGGDDDGPADPDPDEG